MRAVKREGKAFAKPLQRKARLYGKQSERLHF
jgi:hypothetical protein